MTEPIGYDALVQGERVHASLYTDPRVFADEMDRIFFRGWVFVGMDRPSQDSPLPIRRLALNTEVRQAEGGELIAESNFILAKQAIQAKHEVQA